jgi:hypothetical protein
MWPDLLHGIGSGFALMLFVIGVALAAYGQANSWWLSKRQRRGRQP